MTRTVGQGKLIERVCHLVHDFDFYEVSCHSSIVAPSYLASVYSPSHMFTRFPSSASLL